jgi:hypothetical protein
MCVIGVYNPLENIKKGERVLHIAVKFTLNKSYGTDNLGFSLISQNLATNDEIDYAADSLIKDIEKARKKAKKILESETKARR